MADILVSAQKKPYRLIFTF